MSLRNWFRGLFGPRLSFVNRRPRRLEVERLEERITPSTADVAFPLYVRMHNALAINSQPTQGGLMDGSAFEPAGLQLAYGVTPLLNVNDNGAEQTIALIDAYDDPDFVDSTSSNFDSSDLHIFDTEMGLPDPPSFIKVSQSGGTPPTRTDPAGPGNNNSEGEEALDVEWAHAMAPDANIILVECNSLTTTSLFAGAKWAAKSSSSGGGGATVVSMSFGVSGGEPSETSLDSNFSPTTYPGVTFLASTDDDGSVNGQGAYPADSPDVVAVGGTSLTADVGAGAAAASSLNGESVSTAQLQTAAADIRFRRLSVSAAATVRERPGWPC